LDELGKISGRDLARPRSEVSVLDGIINPVNNLDLGNSLVDEFLYGTRSDQCGMDDAQLFSA
jgi:hypothetical protein